MNKYSIIGGDIHKLVRIPPRSKQPFYAWLIHEEDDWYWVPVEDCKASHTKGSWYWRPALAKECPTCKIRWKELTRIQICE